MDSMISTCKKHTTYFVRARKGDQKMYRTFRKNHRIKRGKAFILNLNEFLKNTLHTTLHYTTTIILLNYYLTTTYFVNANEKPLQLLTGAFQ